MEKSFTIKLEGSERKVAELQGPHGEVYVYSGFDPEPYYLVSTLRTGAEDKIYRSWSKAIRKATEIVD